MAQAKQQKQPTRSFSALLVAIFAPLFVVAVLVLAIIAVNQHDKTTPNDKLVPPTTENFTVEGQLSCLPVKGDGPHTLECATAIKTDDGSYYGLNFVNVDETGFPTGQNRLRITGTLKAPRDTYVNDGVIEVESFKEL